MEFDLPPRYEELANYTVLECPEGNFVKSYMPDLCPTLDFVFVPYPPELDRFIPYIPQLLDMPESQKAERALRLYLERFERHPD